MARSYGVLEQSRSDRPGFVENPPDYYNVKMNEVAVSTGELQTSALYTCVGLAITQNEKKLLAHVTAGTNEWVLAAIIGQNFDKTQPMKVTLINGGDGPMTGHATTKCLRALELGGIEGQPGYFEVSGGFMSTVQLLHNHVLDTKDTSGKTLKTAKLEPALQKLVDEFIDNFRLSLKQKPRGGEPALAL
jgi:hypothetical protein